MPEVAQRSHSRRRRQPGPGASWRDTATAALPVLACFLGGATQKWAEGIVLVLLGLLLLTCPPRVSLGPTVNLIVVGLLATAAMGFLPATWFFEPEWRRALVNDFGINIASTLSPQPWITVGCLASFVAGLSWFYYVATQEIENRAVRHQFRMFAGGLVLLAALCIALYAARTALPFWHNQRGFGPFPNRNQTANVFGLASVLVLACGHDDLRQGKKRWLLWLVGLVLLTAAIVLNFSRAGIGILVLGSGMWLGALGLRSRSKGMIAIGASALLVLLTALLIFGGETLERFNLRAANGIGVSREFRWLIFRDVWQMIHASPWPGVGLGNFEPVFAVLRDASIVQSRALHPESDWFWLCAELGWPAVVLILAGAVILTRRIFPLSEGTAQRFRLAAFIGAILFALHAAVDVAGHRVGSAAGGLFLFGLALRRPDDQRPSAWLPYLFRFSGAVFLAIGAIWITASYRHLSIPGGLGVDNETHLAKSANIGRQPQETIAHATKALDWAPLDWQLYFLRALGKVAAKQPAEALDDFRRARFLEPSSFEVPYQEGLAWLPTQPTLAITAWREALRRAGPDRPALYDRMLSSASQSNRAVNQMLEEFGSVHPDLALTYLGRSKGDNFNSAVARLTAHDPKLQTLTTEQKAKLFSLWAERGDLARLAAFVTNQPDLLGFAWRGVAKFHASQREFRAACELATRFTETPKLPEPTRGATIEQLQAALYSTPNNFGVGFSLFDGQMRAGKLDDALTTLRHFTDTAGCPAYFHYLEAEAWAAKENWERAWTAWQAFAAAKGK